MYGNVLVGYLFDSSRFPAGSRIMTEAIRWVDWVNQEAECLDGFYRLGEPGTEQEHQHPLLGE